MINDSSQEQTGDILNRSEKHSDQQNIKSQFSEEQVLGHPIVGESPFESYSDSIDWTDFLPEIKD